MNVYKSKTGQLWFEMRRDAEYVYMHQELRTGWEIGPESILLRDFHSMGFILIYEGEEGERIARETLGNHLMRKTHPLKDKGT